MKVDIKNLGIVAKGSIDCAKPLILMCGPNSTGKTYVSYLIYALFSSTRNNNLLTRPLSFFSDIYTQLLENGEFELTEELVSRMLDLEANQIKSSMRSLFSLPADMNNPFSRFSISLSVSSELFNTIIDSPISLVYRGFSFENENIIHYLVKLTKEAKSNVVKFKSDSEQYTSFADVRNRQNLIRDFLHMCTHFPVADANMLTVERNSIYTFSKELSLYRQNLTDNIKSVENDEGQLIKLVSNKISRYPLPINQSLRIANDLDYVRKQRSEFYEFGCQLETSLLNGSLSVTSTGAVEFIPDSKTKTQTTLPIHMSSSIVKTLSSLIIYLKHIAEAGDMLIIDEPEMNLHPDNQILIARIFARLVNKGLRLVVSTHSDYIVRELNNLVMANVASRKKDTPLQSRNCMKSPNSLTRQRLNLSIMLSTDAARSTSCPYRLMSLDSTLSPSTRPSSIKII